MLPQDLLGLLGRHDTDPLVEAALSYYGVRNRPEVTVDESDPDGPVVETQSWVKNSRVGIEFGFDDEAAWIGLDETEFGKRPMLLTQIYLFGEHHAARPYLQPLPFGLELSDDRMTIRKKLQALESTRHSYVRDTWDAPGFRMTVAFTPGDRSIRFVLCQLREPPLPPLGYALAPVPAAATLIGLLDRPLDDAAVQSAFEPLGLQNQLAAIEESGEGDFRIPYGLTLGFSAPRNATGSEQRQKVLSHLTLYRERELDARRWPGDLPCGIVFDDSPEAATRKVGRPPDKQLDDEEDSFSGYALWHEPRFSLHIFYSTIENRIFRVSLFAPGSWEKLDE